MFRNLSKTVIQHLPTIMTVAGSAGVVVGSVMACKATLKADEVLSENRIAIESVKESGIASPSIYRKSLTTAYAKGLVNWVKLYGPPAIVIGFSIGSILYGHNMLRMRSLAVLGAYKALTIEHQEYREKMKDALGVEEERNIKYNVGTVIAGDLDTGEEKEIQIVPEDPDIPGNEHAKFFCQSSIYWTKNPEENLKFLLDVMGRMQEKFDRQGYLFLNDVYTALDIPITYGGSVCGWVKGLGDNVIDFGIFDCYREANRRFVNGYEPVILLDFNHDGYILDKI